MKLPARQALVCWLAGAVVSAGVRLLVLGVPASADSTGEVIGRLLAHTGLAALFTWMTVRKRTPPSSWGTFVFIYVGWYLALLVIAGIGAGWIAS